MTKEAVKPIKDREPDNEAIAAAFESEGDIRSNCGICKIQIVGTMAELAEHFRSCNGPG